MTSAGRDTAGAPLVLLSQRLGALTPNEERIREAGAEIASAPLWSLEEIREVAASARLIILGAVEPFGAEALEALPKLEAIVRRGVGTDNVDLAVATELGIIVANVPDASVEEVSDHALALLLTLERGVIGLDRGVRSGAWSHDSAAIQALRRPIRRLSDLTLGIVGYGRIGQALGRKSIAIYARVLAADPVVSAEVARRTGVELVELGELLSRSNHVSVHAPLTEATRNVIDAGALGRMPAGSVLVNTARGGLVDEAAVINALDDGHLRAAGLDVTVDEPLGAGSRLLGDDRILLTAHSASSSVAADHDLAARSVDAVVAILRGDRPASIANPEVLRSAVLRASRLATNGPDLQPAASG